MIDRKVYAQRKLFSTAWDKYGYPGQFAYKVGLFIRRAFRDIECLVGCHTFVKKPCLTLYSEFNDGSVGETYFYAETCRNCGRIHSVDVPSFDYKNTVKDKTVRLV